MVRIPRSEPTVPVRLADQPTMSPDALTGPGRALQQLGRAIGGLQGAFEGMAEPSQQDQFNAQMNEINAHNEANAYFTERSNSMPGDADPAEWQRGTMSGIDSIYGKYRESVPAYPKLQQRYDLNYNRFRGSWDTRSLDDAAKVTINRNVQSTAETLATTIAQQAKDSPEFARVLDSVDAKINEIPGASEAQRAAVREKVAEAAHAKFMEGAAKDPVAAEDAAKRAIEQWGRELQAPAPAPGQLPREGMPGGPSGRAPERGVGPQSNAAPQPILNDTQKTALKGVRSDVVDKFAQLQGVLGHEFKVNSGYRDPATNARVGGAKQSQHMHGNAIDLDVRDMSHEERINVIEKASALGFTGIGVYNNAIHLDLGGRRSWGPSYGSDSVPGWAKGTIAGHLKGRFANGGEGTIALSGLSGDGPRFGRSVDAAIESAAKRAGLDPGLLRVFAKIESGGDPSQRTGSYKGLFQLSNGEFSKYGGGNIYDAGDNANAAALKLRAEAQRFEARHGRPPTATDLYLVHQQGEAGYAAHLANPDDPAWKNMYSTGEGQSKGAGWAKRAIWGNVPSDLKRRYGSVDNMTSRDFIEMWDGKVKKFGGGGGAAVAQSNLAPNEAPDPSRKGGPPMAERSLTAYAGSVKVASADGSGVDYSRVNGDARPSQMAGTPDNRIPGTQVAENLSPEEWAKRRTELQAQTPPGRIEGTDAAGGLMARPGSQWVRPSIRTKLIEMLQKDMPRLEKARVMYLDSVVKRAEDVAAKGYTLTPDERAQAFIVLQDKGSPEQMARFQAAEAAAYWTSERRKMPPQVLDREIIALRADAEKNGSTPERLATIQAAEKLQSDMARELSSDPIGWASKVGAIPPQAPITPQNFSAATLAMRAEAVKAVQQIYGIQYAQFFSNDVNGANERKMLEAQFARGGDTMLQMVGTMYEAFGSDMPRALSEIAPKSPEAVRAGYLIVSGGDDKAIQDIAKTIERRNDPNYQRAKFDDADQVTAEKAYFKDFFKTVPQGDRVRDATIAAAKAIYEARSEDRATFDPELYTQALKDAMGEVKRGEAVYGGVVDQSYKIPGDWLSSKTQIMLPSNIPQELWSTIYNHITPEMLQRAGHDVPVDRKGQPIPIEKLLNGRLESIGDGQYRVEMSNQDREKGWALAMPSAPGSAKSDAAAPMAPNRIFVLDIKKLAPELRRLYPGLIP